MVDEFQPRDPGVPIQSDNDVDGLSGITRSVDEIRVQKGITEDFPVCEKRYGRRFGQGISKGFGAFEKFARRHVVAGIGERDAAIAPPFLPNTFGEFDLCIGAGLRKDHEGA